MWGRNQRLGPEIRGPLVGSFSPLPNRLFVVWLFGWDLLQSDDYLDDADSGLQASVYLILPQDENVHPHFISSLQDHSMLLPGALLFLLDKQTFPLGQNCNHSHCGKFGKGKKVKVVNRSRGWVQCLVQPQLTCQ